MQIRLEAGFPPTAPLLQMRDSHRGALSSSLIAFLSSSAGQLLARIPWTKSPFLNRLRELALAVPSTTGELDTLPSTTGQLDILLGWMKREASKIVGDDFDKVIDAMICIKNIVRAISVLLPANWSEEYLQLVGVEWTGKTNCTSCHQDRNLPRIIEPWISVKVPKQGDLDLVTAIKEEMGRRKRGHLVDANCTSCPGTEAWENFSNLLFPQTLIVAVDKEAKNGVTTKQLPGGNLIIGEVCYKLKAVIFHLLDQTFGNSFYTDIIYRNRGTSSQDEFIRYWRCHQEDRQGCMVQELDEDQEFINTFNWGHVYFFERQQEQDEEISVGEREAQSASSSVTRFGPSPEDLNVSPQRTGPPLHLTPRSSATSSGDFLSSVDKDLVEVSPGPKLVRLPDSNLPGSLLADDLPGEEGEKRLKDRLDNQCFKCWRDPTDEKGRVVHCGFCNRLLCPAHGTPCYKKVWPGRGSRKILCNDCRKKSTAEWCRDQQRQPWPCLDNKGSLTWTPVPSEHRPDYFEDNSKNQVPEKWKDMCTHDGTLKSCLSKLEQVYQQLMWGNEDEGELSLLAESIEDNQQLCSTQALGEEADLSLALSAIEEPQTMHSSHVSGDDIFEEEVVAETGDENPAKRRRLPEWMTDVPIDSSNVGLEDGARLEKDSVVEVTERVGVEVEEPEDEGEAMQKLQDNDIRQLAETLEQADSFMATTNVEDIDLYEEESDEEEIVEIEAEAVDEEGEGSAIMEAAKQSRHEREGSENAPEGGDDVVDGEHLGKEDVETVRDQNLEGAKLRKEIEELRQRKEEREEEGRRKAEQLRLLMEEDEKQAAKYTQEIEEKMRLLGQQETAAVEKAIGEEAVGENVEKVAADEKAAAEQASAELAADRTAAAERERAERTSADKAPVEIAASENTPAEKAATDKEVAAAEKRSSFDGMSTCEERDPLEDTVSR